MSPVPAAPGPAWLDRYDVVVLGGGPAGATTAALLAERGHRVAVLERSAFPRFHVGESLIPETYGTLKRLGLIEKLRQSAFPKKYSVQFVSESGKESRPFYFDEHVPAESSQTWQVWREQFDQMLLDAAIERGAIVQTQVQAVAALFDGDRVIGVRARRRNDSSETFTLRCRVLVDATGQSTFLASRLGLKQPDARLRMASVWSYFRGAHRGSGKDEGATIILQTPGKKSWFWYIPLPDDIVSVGCTGRLDYLFGDEGLSAAQVFERELGRCPALERRLAGATRERDYLVTRDFSYRTGQGAGPGWVLVGDALGFIDPVYSSGVFLALKSGEMAADAIDSALRTGDLSAKGLGGWQPRFAEGVDRFRRLVYAFYDPQFSFGRFLRQFPQHGARLADILRGRVFEPEIEKMFRDMES
ncbi:MAG: NAD(P)/FAD-dependent oxidoreductase [Planctomycetes bacterium]|nr:NAD(P)/FAD-dependent oxidoreductase [Planctomycetota bacterium]